MNKRALELTHILAADSNGREPHGQARGLLPESLLAVCQRLFLHLQERDSAKDWEQFEVNHVLQTSQRQILVRGYGIPDGSGAHSSRVVVILQEIGMTKVQSSVQRKERYQFTDREEEVLQCLAKGWSNKEIGAQLRIALPTVKEHVHHIMEKTKTTSRTGIIVKLFGN